MSKRKPRFVLTPDAEADLLEIAAFIARDSRTAARRVVREIRAEIRRLASQPWLGHRREEVTDLPLRFWAVYSYLILYRENEKPLQIVRILHGARDLPAVLRRLK